MKISPLEIPGINVYSIPGNLQPARKSSGIGFSGNRSLGAYVFNMYNIWHYPYDFNLKVSLHNKNINLCHFQFETYGKINNRWSFAQKAVPKFASQAQIRKICQPDEIFVGTHFRGPPPTESPNIWVTSKILLAGNFLQNLQLAGKYYQLAAVWKIAWFQNIFILTPYTFCKKVSLYDFFLLSNFNMKTKSKH